MAKFDPKPHIRKVIYTNKRTGEKTTVEILDTGPRLAWFRSEHPIDEGWQIITECLALDDSGAHYQAKVINPEGKIISTGHRLVFKADFGNFNEKAETQAIGRALAAAGYGTLQAVEPEDGEEEPSQLPDTPVPSRRVPRSGKKEDPLEFIMVEANAQLEAMKLDPHYKDKAHTLNAIKACGHENVTAKYFAENHAQIVAELVDRVKAEEEIE